MTEIQKILAAIDASVPGVSIEEIAEQTGISELAVTILVGELERDDIIDTGPSGLVITKYGDEIMGTRAAVAQ